MRKRLARALLLTAAGVALHCWRLPRDPPAHDVGAAGARAALRIDAVAYIALGDADLPLARSLAALRRRAGFAGPVYVFVDAP